MGKPSVYFRNHHDSPRPANRADLEATILEETAAGGLPRPGQGSAEELGLESPAGATGPGDVSDSSPSPERGPAPEVRIGTVLGKCLLTEQLGQGSTGLVFRGLHQTLNIPVAVKVLRPSSSPDDRQIYQNLKLEARLLAQLNHPHIVRIWDFEDDPERPYLVLEYIEGLNLEQLIRQSGRLRLDRALQIIGQVASGLGAAWKIGVIHRDVKPGNILLDKEGQAKLADLGQAHVAREQLRDRLGHSRALTGGITGTPAYMAPEQFVGSAPIDFRSDIYALGASLYHVLTGRVPFLARSYQELLCKHAREQPVPAHQLVPELGAAVSDVLGTMMAKDPNDRYQSYEEVTAALAGLPLAAPSGSPAAPVPATPPDPNGPPAKPLPSLEEALTLLKAGDKVHATALLHALTQHEPRNESAWLYLAAVIDTPVEVLIALQRVLEINPTNRRARAWIHRARLRAGIAEAKAGNKKAARAYLTQVLRKDPGKESAWLWLAAVAHSREEAIACLERAVKINPNNQQACKDLAWHRSRVDSRKRRSP